MLIYLGLSAIATFLAALLLLWLGDPSLPAVAHLVFAVGILPLIFGAITHFVPVLTRSAGAKQNLLLAPLLLQLTGGLAFLDLSGAAPAGSAIAAASGTLLIAVFLAGWLVRRARRTLGRPHPGWIWYLAAIVFLCLALLCVPAMSWWPAARPEFRLLHLHLNTLGFIGLTALGTLQVLLPTVLNSPDAQAANRLQQDLPVAAGAVPMVALGAAFSPPLSLVGAAMLLYVALRIAGASVRRHGWRALAADGAAAALIGALGGFLLLLVLGAGHAFGGLAGRDAVAAFVVAFLLPLLTGALTQLLPVSMYPGRRTPARDRMHAALRSGGALRGLLFICGGVLLGLGVRDGSWPALAGLLSFVVVLLRSLFAARYASDRRSGVPPAQE